MVMIRINSELNVGNRELIEKIEKHFVVNIEALFSICH